MLALALGLVLASAARATPQYVRNGGFEQGFAFWSGPPADAFAYAMSAPYDGFSVRQGRRYALLGARGDTKTVSQTVTDTPGDILIFSFFLGFDGGAPASFVASFNGQALLALTDMPAFAWRYYGFRVRATGSDTISFTFRNDPGYWALDGVSLRPPLGRSAAAVRLPIPEPSSWALLAGGMLAAAGLATWRWARRSRPPA